MKQVYSAYLKQVNDVTYFFVKKYQSFPDIPGIPDIQQGFGMHENFEKACAIAGLTDATCMQELYQACLASLPQAKIIELSTDANPAAEQQREAV
jgi:hypothetical protein